MLEFFCTQIYRNVSEFCIHMDALECSVFAFWSVVCLFNKTIFVNATKIKQTSMFFLFLWKHFSAYYSHRIVDSHCESVVVSRLESDAMRRSPLPNVSDDLKTNCVAKLNLTFCQNWLIVCLLKGVCTAVFIAKYIPINHRKAIYVCIEGADVTFRKEIKQYFILI